MEKNLEVRYGTIYTKDGIGIDHIAVIIDKEAGLMKYGDKDKIKECYDDMVDKYLKAGFEDIAGDLLFISFDRYDGILSIDEICTFVNYMSMTSAIGDKVMKFLSLNENELKAQLKIYSEIGY